jgi:hypothetical protein
MDLNKLLKTQWDRTGAIVLSVLGAIFLFVGWIGVSGTPLLAEQAPYILSGGVGGMFLLGLGATLWISADLRDEWRKLDRIEQAIGDGTLRWAEVEPVGVEAPRQFRPEALRVAPAPVLASPEAPAAASSNGGAVNGAAKAARTARKTEPARTATAARRPRVKAASHDA